MANKNHRHLAVIPARGGSKRLPKKNIAELYGKPLISYTIEAALGCGCFDKILFSSDDDKILTVAARYNGITIEKRPSALAGDKIKVIDLVREIVKRPDYQDRFDTLSLLLPTCPFRTSRDIDAGFELLTESIDSVVSATNFEFPIQMSMKIDNETKKVDYLFNPSPLVIDDTRSQDHRPVYRPNGGFYISWWHRLKINCNFFRGKVRGYVMSREKSADIDTKLDLLYAEFLLRQGVVRIDNC